MIDEKYNPLRGLDFDEEDDIELLCFRKQEPRHRTPERRDG